MSADRVTSPTVNMTKVVAVSGGGASAAAKVPARAGQYFSVGIDDGSGETQPVWWIIFDDENDMSAPDPDSASAVCFGPYTGVESFIAAGHSVWFRTYSVSAYKLRVTPSE